MNPEGRKTPNTGSSIDQRIKKAIEQRDHTTASQGRNGQTPPTTSAPSHTELQQKLNELKQKYPHLFPQNQTPNSPSASSNPSPSL